MLSVGADLLGLLGPDLGADVRDDRTGQEPTPRTWADELEADAAGFRPDRESYADDFPRTREDAWTRYLASHERVSEVHAQMTASAAGTRADADAPRRTTALETIPEEAQPPTTGTPLAAIAEEAELPAEPPTGTALRGDEEPVSTLPGSRTDDLSNGADVREDNPDGDDARDDADLDAGGRTGVLRSGGPDTAGPSGGHARELAHADPDLAPAADRGSSPALGTSPATPADPATTAAQAGRTGRADRRRPSPLLLPDSAPSLLPDSEARPGSPLAGLTDDYTVVRADGAKAGGVFRRITSARLSDGTATDSDGTARYANGTARDSDGTAPGRLVTVEQHILTEDHPRLRVSGDGTLAVGEGEEVQEAFATRRAFERASAALRAAGSTVELVLDQDVSIALRHNGADRVLFRVRPKSPPTTDVCRDVARDVLGGAPDHLVFRDARGVIGLGPMNAADGLKVSEMHRLAAAVTDVADGSRTTARTPDVAWAAEKARGGSRPEVPPTPLPGRRYGAQLGALPGYSPQGRALGNTAGSVGINDHAWAEIGEAYLTQSIGAPDEQGGFVLGNYAEAYHPVDHPFGYHFAAPILTSEDGDSAVTLENYARGGGRRRLLTEAVERNLALHADRLEEIEAAHQDQANRLQPGRERDAAAASKAAAASLRLLRDARSRSAEVRGLDGAEQADREAERALGRAVSSLGALSNKLGLSRPEELWHLRFVSRRPQETFHDAVAGMNRQDRPGIVVAPLTAVVVGAHRPPSGPSSWFTFAEGQMRLSKEESRGLDHLAARVARVGLWNHAHGLPLPVVNISVGGNGSRDSFASLPGVQDRAKRTAQARLNWLVADFRERLQASLRILRNGQGAVGGPTAREFTIHSHNRGRDLPGTTLPGTTLPSTESRPELRRRAVFDVDMHPASQGHLSPAAEDTLRYLAQGSAQVASLLSESAAHPGSLWPATAVSASEGVPSPRPVSEDGGLDIAGLLGASLSPLLPSSPTGHDAAPGETGETGETGDGAAGLFRPPGSVGAPEPTDVPQHADRPSVAPGFHTAPPAGQAERLDLDAQSAPQGLPAQRGPAASTLLGDQLPVTVTDVTSAANGSDGTGRSGFRPGGAAPWIRIGRVSPARVLGGCGVRSTPPGRTPLMSPARRGSTMRVCIRTSSADCSPRRPATCRHDR